MITQLQRAHHEIKTEKQTVLKEICTVLKALALTFSAIFEGTLLVGMSQKVFPTILLSKNLKFCQHFCEETFLKFNLGRIVMRVFEPITSQHFETALTQNNVVSNAIKRDRWIAISNGN